MAHDRIEPGFPVVAIGASAGGVEALSAFFKRLPLHPQAAFIVITHLAAHQKSMLPEILGRCTAMPVATASDGQEMEAGHVYVIPPDGILTLADGHLALSPRHDERNTIDLCLATLADEVGERAIAIILSGTGTDGAIGLKAVRTAGGFTLAQGSDGTTPSHHGMPDAAIATGFVDCTLPVEPLADRVAAYIDAAATSSWPGVVGDDEATTRLKDVKRELCAQLQSRVGHDFSGYKQNTFMRRAERRMHVRHVPDLQSYLQLIRNEPAEIDALFRDLLIGVTEFFRDMASFEALGKVAAPRLLDGKGPTDTVRVWIPGCATGEEAYSVAIILLEQLGKAQAQPRLQIFATDVDEKALAVARAGRYPQRLLDRMPRGRRERFFVQQGGSYVVAKELRDTCLFSCHSLVRDPPFSRIDLISCRNLLIYLNVDLQNQVIPLFHYALRPDGYLFLGASEHVSQHTKLFAPVDKKHRIFQRRHLASRAPIFPSFRLAAAGYSAAAGEDRGLPGGRDAVRRLEAVVLDKYAPAHLIVNGEWDVIHYSARTGKYLEAPAGAPNRNLLAMARNGLRLPLRSALHEAAQTQRRTVRQNIGIEAGSGSQTIDLSVEPLPDAAAGAFWLVVFTDIGEAGHGTAGSRQTNREAGGGPNDHEDAVHHLEEELRQTHELLRSSIEEYQGLVEELKSSNEEMLSINEELQSSNEELETAKEELQSVNEELLTVNAELSHKVDELDRSNSDLKNLFDSTQIATLFLDGNLVIRSFTPAVSEIFKLIPGDCGRPLSDIVSFLAYHDLAADVAATLASSQPLERKLVSNDGRVHYLMRILPYRTGEGEVDGVVVTFVNVSPLVRLDEQQALVAELNHRVKNILAVVASMAVQMAQRCSTVEEFAEAFIGRIHGLAKTHDILSLNSWTSIGLRGLIAGEMKAFIADTGRASLAGPEVYLQPRAATTLGIIIHELATNASKYGAFANSKGRLEVAWGFQSVAGVRHIVLKWQERDGPPAHPPKRSGFGTELIERSIEFEFGGSATLDYRPEGLVATLSFPADAVITEEVRNDA